MPEAFSDNAAQSRFELDVEGRTVFANYRRMGDQLAILHVESPPVLRGTGAAGRLMQHIVDTAQAENRAIAPYCGYAASWLRRRR
jgi:hypothetical protein